MDNFSKTGLSILNEMYQQDIEDGLLEDGKWTLKKYSYDFFEISENEIMRRYKMTFDEYMNLLDKMFIFAHTFIYNNGAQGVIVSKYEGLEDVLKEREVQ